MRVPCWPGHSGPDGVASRDRGGVFPVSARGGLGPWGGPHTSHEGGAEGAEDLVHNSCVRCLSFRLSANGGEQVFAQRERPDLVDCEDRAQVSRTGPLRCFLLWGDGLKLLLAVQVEPPRRRPVLGVRPAALSPPPEAVEGMPWVPAAGFIRHDSRQGVLVVVATFQHDHGNGAGVIFAAWGSRACRLRPWWISLHHVPEVAPPVKGCPPFPVRQAIVLWDVEGVSPRLWGGPFPAPGAWRGPGLCRQCNEPVPPAQVRDPHAFMVRLVEGDK